MDTTFAVATFLGEGSSAFAVAAVLGLDVVTVGADAGALLGKKRMPITRAVAMKFIEEAFYGLVEPY
mgnify:CR=1 FL=1